MDKVSSGHLQKVQKTLVTEERNDPGKPVIVTVNLVLD